MVTYYCTSSRHELIGPKKITCLKDGSYNADAPRCGEIGDKKFAAVPDILPPLAAVPNLKTPRNRDPGSRRPGGGPENADQTFGRVRVRKPPRAGGPKFPPRDKFAPDRSPYEPARAPIDNEIPDSANVQSSPAAGADVPQPVEGGQQETRQAQLNLGELFLLKNCIFQMGVRVCEVSRSRVGNP